MNFPDDTFIKPIPLHELARELDQQTGSIDIPKFQREVIWDEQRVELLWDSIIRGFPIGAIMLGKRVEYEQDTKSGRKVEYIIIDGQQRANSLSSGYLPWLPGNHTRLWVDMNNSKHDDYDRNFDIRLYACTSRKPWGHTASYAQIRKALRELSLKYPELNYDEILESYDNNNLDLDRTWPVRASIPIPLLSILNLEEDGNWIENIPGYIPESLLPDNIEDSVNAQAIIKKIKKARDYQIPIFFIHGLDDIEALGLAFQRINHLGVQMTEEELFFSGLKTILPETYDLVHAIFDDLNTGKFLEPSKIVHNVMRLAVARIQPNGREELNDLKLHDFKTLMRDDYPEREQLQLEVLRYLRPKTKGKSSPYHDILSKAKRFLQYNEKSNPIGLPLTLLKNLNKRVWHTLTAWIDRFPEIEPYENKESETKLEMIRYALFDLLYFGTNYSGFTRIPFEIACNANTDCFPGYWIYQELKSQYIKLITPERYKDFIFNMHVDSEEPNLYQENPILHWSQRHYLTKWYPHYDPTKYRYTEDLPYDVDHIIASYYFDRRSVRNPHPDFEKNIIRKGIVNCIGNYRLWPKSLNRSDQEKTLSQKYILGIMDTVIPVKADKSEPGYLRKKPYECHTVGDVRKASFIDENEIQKWEKASNESNDSDVSEQQRLGALYDWSDALRVEAFVQAVQGRRVRLYEELYTALSWSNWLVDREDKPQLYRVKYKK